MPKHTPRPTGEVVREQSTIERLADIHKKRAIELIASQKRFMKANSDAPYQVWRVAVLKRFRKELEKFGKQMSDEIVRGAYVVNQKDTIEVKNLGLQASRKAASRAKTTGKAVGQNIKDLVNSAYGSMSAGIVRYNEQGLRLDEITNSIIGSASKQYKNGDLISYVNATRMHSTTNSKSAGEAVRQKRYQEDSTVIGYLWVSTLDERTSTTCMGLNGKKYYYGTSGFKPLPPIHPNCRSTTEPIFADEPEPEVRETFDEWLTSNPEEVREALGEEQYDLLKKPGKAGGLRITRFTDARFKTLPLDDIVKQL